MQSKDPRGHAGRGSAVPYDNDSAIAAHSLDPQFEHVAL
jgi:hypothetical protein